MLHSNIKFSSYGNSNSICHTHEVYFKFRFKGRVKAVQFIFRKKCIILKLVRFVFFWTKKKHPNFFEDESFEENLLISILNGFGLCALQWKEQRAGNVFHSFIQKKKWKIRFQIEWNFRRNITEKVVRVNFTMNKKTFNHFVTFVSQSNQKIYEFWMNRCELCVENDMIDH